MSKKKVHSSGGTNRKNIFFNNTGKGVEIVSVADPAGAVYHDAAKEIEVKSLDWLNEKLEISYQVHDHIQRISLWIEHPSGQVHDSFYRQYKSNIFFPPRVALLINDVVKTPGCHSIKWDGRDHTKDRRILLAGTYKIIVEGSLTGALKRRDSSDIKFAKPVAFNFGIDYLKKGNRESTKKEVHHAESRQTSLLDQTGYKTNSYFDYDADQAADSIMDSALVYWSGHSGPGGLIFHGKEGTKYTKKDKSKLVLYQSGVDSPDKSIAAIRNEKPDSFKDLLLIVLNGCRPANEIMQFQTLLAMFDPKGVDGKHGANTTKALRAYQVLNRLKQTEGLKTAETISWFKLDEFSHDPKQLTEELQKKMTSYNPGKADGKLGKKTITAIENYQRDHPHLTVTGEADDATADALSISKRPQKGWAWVPYNVTNALTHIGTDIAVGFTHKIDFDLAEDWAIKFWNQLAEGKGV